MDLSFQAKSILSKFTAAPKHPQFLFLGFGSDEGTRRNNGRVGAERFPALLREELDETSWTGGQLQIFDLGDINRDDFNSLEQTHQKLLQTLTQGLRRFPSIRSLVIGGSNDQSYYNAKALLNCFKDARLSVVNIDAHLDVRPLKQGLAHSGSPFRQLLEDPCFNGQFYQFGSKGSSVSQAHTQYVLKKGGKIIWMQRDIRRIGVSKLTQGGQAFRRVLVDLQSRSDIIFVSFDLDCLDARYMPGVSAPNITGGLTLDQATQIVRLSASSSKVLMLDMSEGNPAVQREVSLRTVSSLVRVICECWQQR